MPTRREAVLGALGLVGGAMLPTQQAVERVNQAGPAGSPTNPGYSLRQQQQEDRAVVSARARYEAALEGWKRRPGEQEDPELPAKNMYEKDEEAMQEILAIQSEKYRDPVSPPPPAPAPAHEAPVGDSVFQQVAPTLRVFEGGFRAGHAGKGGSGDGQDTNRGITADTLKEARRTSWGKNLPDDVRKLTERDADLIAYEKYWKGGGFDKYKDPGVAFFAFDSSFQHGPGNWKAIRDRPGHDPNDLDSMYASRLEYLKRHTEYYERLAAGTATKKGVSKAQAKAYLERNVYNGGLRNRIDKAYAAAKKLQGRS